MAVANPKNLALAGASADLGLGDMLQQQTEDELANRDSLKKKQLGLDPTVISPATASLLGNQRAY